MTSSPKRLIELDALRGLAALIVVVHHAWLSLPDRPEWLQWLLETTPLRPVAMGRQAVIFFFVLSGFVLTRALASQESRQPGSVLSLPGGASYAAQRAVRLGLPVLAAVLFSATLQSALWSGPLPSDTPHIVAGAAWAQMWDWSSLLAQVALFSHGDGFQLDPVLWSLVHEWRVALLLPLVLLLRGRLAILGAVALLGAGVARLAGMPEGSVSLGDSVPLTFAASAGFLPAFAAGAALALHPVDRLDRGQALAAGLAVAVLAMTASDYGVIIGSVLLILLAQRQGALARALCRPAPLWLGRISFSLYLIHMPVLLALTHVLRGWVSPVGVALLAIPVSLPLAAIMHRAVEQPAHHLARRMRWVPARPAES